MTKFIAIDGHGGSGKSTLAKEIARELGAEIIHTDDFASFDNYNNWWPLVIKHIFKPIQEGATKLSYSRSKWWKDHEPKPVIDQPVTDIIIIEGVSSLRKEFREFIDFGVYVETPKEVCLQRGLERDRGQDGKSDAEILELWNGWLKNEDDYIARDNPKGYANVVIDGTGSLSESVSAVKKYFTAITEKSSADKTKVSTAAVSDFVVSNHGALKGSLNKLSEGHISQAFSFTSIDNRKLVIRLGRHLEDFKKDRYAYLKLDSSKIPVPEVLSIGDFSEDIYYCISVFVEGIQSDKLTNEQMNISLKSQLDSFAKIFKTQISSTSGWGMVDIETGNAKHDSWKKPLLKKINKIDKASLENNIVSLGMDKELIGKFYDQFYSNLEVLKEPVRRLVHGDLGFDNVLMSNSRVVAIIDWGAIKYSDWMSDMARCEFWWPGRYGDIKEFAQRYELDDSDIDKRLAMYWGYGAITTVEFAFSSTSESTKQWIKNNLKDRLI